MDANMTHKITVGFVVLVATVIYGVLRLGGGTAAAAAMGYFPMSMIPARLRHFLFGEQK
jgi:hypothetical protein